MNTEGDLTTWMCYCSLGERDTTHLKVGQNHFSVHVAVTVGGHRCDWLNDAILLPLA